MLVKELGMLMLAKTMAGVYVTVLPSAKIRKL